MSTNKTQNYQLHAWEPVDDFLLSEFNENFAAIDGILPQSKCLQVVVGSYTGNGVGGQQIIPLEFRPRVVLISPKHGYSSQHMLICVDGVEHMYAEMVENGFIVKAYLNSLPTYSDSNMTGSYLNPYTYMALTWKD